MASHILRLVQPAGLRAMGESLSAKFAEVGARPHADACDLLMRDLVEARNAVARLRDQLIQAFRVPD